MTWKTIIQRFLIPQIAINLYYMLRFHCIISPKTEIELSPMVQLGKGVTISSFTKIKATHGPLIIGANTGFAASCYISVLPGGITIGKECLFGPHVNVLSGNYNLEASDQPFSQQGHTSKGVKIGDNVWIGAGTTILDGTILGDNTVVVANSLVNRRYPSNVIIQGNPAKIILRRTERSTHGKNESV